MGYCSGCHCKQDRCCCEHGDWSKAIPAVFVKLANHYVFEVMDFDLPMSVRTLAHKLYIDQKDVWDVCDEAFERGVEEYNFKEGLRTE